MHDEECVAYWKRAWATERACLSSQQHKIERQAAMRHRHKLLERSIDRVTAAMDRQHAQLKQLAAAYDKVKVERDVANECCDNWAKNSISVEDHALELTKQVNEAIAEDRAERSQTSTISDIHTRTAELEAEVERWKQIERDTDASYCIMRDEVERLRLRLRDATQEQCEADRRIAELETALAKAKQPLSRTVRPEVSFDDDSLDNHTGEKK